MFKALTALFIFQAQAIRNGLQDLSKDQMKELHDFEEEKVWKHQNTLLLLDTADYSEERVVIENFEVPLGKDGAPLYLLARFECIQMSYFCQRMKTFRKDPQFVFMEKDSEYYYPFKYKGAQEYEIKDWIDSGDYKKARKHIPIEDIVENFHRSTEAFKKDFWKICEKLFYLVGLSKLSYETKFNIVAICSIAPFVILLAILLIFDGPAAKKKKE